MKLDNAIRKKIQLLFRGIGIYRVIVRIEVALADSVKELVYALCRLESRASKVFSLRSINQQPLEEGPAESENSCDRQ